VTGKLKAQLPSAAGESVERTPTDVGFVDHAHVAQSGRDFR